MLGNFNKYIDELGHVLLTLTIVLPFQLTQQIDTKQAILVLLASTLIDLDHLFNPIIARVLGIEGTVRPSKKQAGYTIKILHGIDLFFIYAAISYTLTSSWPFSLALFAGLLAHHMWDFIVYDHTWRELFVITRALNRFKPGRRQNYTGLIFKSSSLPM